MKLALSLGLASAQVMYSVDTLSPLDYDWFNYLAKFGKTYATREEFNMRFAIFKANHLLILQHNADPFYTYELKHNKFSDWTDAEWSYMLGYP